MMYLDSTTFLNALLYPDGKGVQALELLQRIYAQRLDACTSVLTWDEVMYKLKQLHGWENAFAACGSLIESHQIPLVACDKWIIQKAQQLMVTHDFLQPRDAIHLATALQMKCDIIVSEDKDFDKIKEIKRKWF